MWSGVLEYNNQILGEPLDDNALAALLGTFNQQSDDGPTLIRSVNVQSHGGQRVAKAPVIRTFGEKRRVRCGSNSRP